ncbi:MAG: ribokinase [Agriterribacter sp.]
MNKGKIIVIGSSNMDMVVKADRIPSPGETILSGDFFMNPGGKGANQAVAAARLGGNVTFVSKLGDDMFGNQFAELFKAEGIDTAHLLYDPQLPSGVALITVDKKGENSIVVASGANAAMLTEDIDKILDEIASADIVLLQLETPMKVVEHIAAFASSKNVKVILNPAPAAALSTELLQYLYMLTPNETEASIITGITVTDSASAEKAAQWIHSKGVQHVVITMSAQGALICEAGKCSMISAVQVKAVDTTAAGDTFNGALSVALSEGKTLTEAVRFGCAAAAISVTRLGAQSSIPYRKELTV